MELIARGRRKQQFAEWAESRRQVSVSEMIAMLDLQMMLIDAPSTSVRQTIDVERLEDEIVSEPPVAHGSHAITLGDGATDKLAAFSDYDTVSEQVFKGAITSKIKHAIKLKTSPARLAQLLQPSLAFCFGLPPMTAYRPVC